MRFDEWLLAILIILLILVAAILVYAIRNGRRWLFDILEQLSFTGIYRDYHYSQRERDYSPQREIDYIVLSAERESGVQLTPRARAMLVIPIIEQIDQGRSVDLDQARSSILIILKTLREDSFPADSTSFGARNTLAVIRGFFQNFCNIPPFCSRTEERSPRSRT
jgi:hypothetical protein